jgi:hypothetical protein
MRCVEDVLRRAHILRMKSKNDSRLQILLPTDQRHALDIFADQIGLSASDVARAAISQMLEQGELTLRPPGGPAVESRA